MSGKQLAFDLSLPFPYSPDAFVVHAGVRPIVERMLSGKSSHLECFIGPERTGKTHLAVHLSKVLSTPNKPVAFVHAQDVTQFFLSPQEAELYIFDDVDRYLETYSLTGSGPLVGFIEFCRARKRGICLFSAQPMETFKVDAHLASRFAAAVSMSIGEPEREDILKLLSAFAAQRALKFDAGVFDFLELRLPASISEMDSYFARLMNLSYVRSGKKVNREMLQDALASNLAASPLKSE